MKTGFNPTRWGAENSVVSQNHYRPSLAKTSEFNFSVQIFTNAMYRPPHEWDTIVSPKPIAGEHSHLIRVRDQSQVGCA